VLRTPLNLLFRPLIISQDGNISQNGLLQECVQQDITFYQLFMLQDDMSLTSQLCYETKADDVTLRTKDKDESLRTPEWKSLRKGWRTQRGIKADSGFIVEADEDSGIDEPTIQDRHKHLPLAAESMANAQQKRTTSNKALYRHAVGNFIQEVNLVSVLGDIMDRLTSESLENTVPLQIM